MRREIAAGRLGAFRVGAGLMGIGCPEELRSALMGHAPQTQNQEYSRPPVAVLRPWVERWAGEVLGESGGEMRKIGG